jgi:hypothetical protein
MGGAGRRPASFIRYMSLMKREFGNRNELPQGKPCGIRFFYEKSVDREEIYIQVLV